MSADEDTDDAPALYPYFSLSGSPLTGLSAEAGFTDADGDVQTKVLDVTGMGAADAQQAFALAYGWYADQLQAMAQGGETADGETEAEEVVR